MRLLKSEITGRDREQIGCITRLSLPSPTHRSDVKLAAQTSPSLEKQTTLQRWTLLLCGFWSPESSWQCDIKAASRLLLAANYIKQPRGFGVSESESTPAFFFPFLATSLRRGVFFGIRDETLDGDAGDRLQPLKKKEHQGRVWQRNSALEDADWRVHSDGRWKWQWQAGFAAVPRLSWADRFMSLLMSVIGLFLKTDLLLPDYFRCHPAVPILFLQYLCCKT